MKITIYTITDCNFSKLEKEYLASKGLTYEEKNLETNREFLTEMLTISNNFAGTPVTKIEKDDGQIIVLKGFTNEEFDAALGFSQTTQAQPAVAPVQTQPSPVVETPVAQPVTPPQPPVEAQSVAVAPVIPVTMSVSQPVQTAPVAVPVMEQPMQVQPVIPVQTPVEVQPIPAPVIQQAMPVAEPVQAAPVAAPVMEQTMQAQPTTVPMNYGMPEPTIVPAVPADAQPVAQPAQMDPALNAILNDLQTKVTDQNSAFPANNPAPAAPNTNNFQG